MKRRTLALVESPAQLLNVLEWASHHGTQADTRLLVLPPRESTTQLQLAAMGDLAKAEGLGVTWYEPRKSAISPLMVVWEMFGKLAKAHRLVIGDPFSRFVQAVLPLTDVPDVVVVDDGTATIDFVNRLARGEQLTRWHLPEGGREVMVGVLSGHAREYLTPSAADGRSVELFSAMPVSPPTGITLTENVFAWTRRRFGPPEVTETTDMVGTSLAETGVISAERYEAGVRLLTREHRPGRYFAHRREADDKLRRIASDTGLKIVRPRVPLEIVAAKGPVGRTIVSFPSTVVHSLPLVLAGTGARLAVCDIPPGWLAGNQLPGALGFLAEVNRTARARHEVG